MVTTTMTTTTTTSGLELAERHPASSSSRPISVNEDGSPHDSQTELANVVSAQAIDATIPDGGRDAWTIIAACAVVSFWFTGCSYSWQGVLQDKLVQDGVADAATLSYVGGLTPACIAVFSMINARLISSIGSRTMAILGVLCVGGGQLFASVNPHSLASLFICIGVIEGIGCSLSFMALSTCPSQYFLRRRGLANGIVYAGGGMGGTVIALAYERLIEQTNLAWTFRIVGLVAILTGTPMACLIKDRVQVNKRMFIDWAFFHDIKFTLFFAVGLISTFPLFVPPFFLPLYGKSIGLSASTGAALVSGFNCASAFGRIGFGLICDSMGSIHALFLSLFLSAISVLAIWPVSQDIGPLTIFVIIAGAANGGFFSTIPTAVASVFGTTKVSVAMGMIVTGWAAGYLMGGPIAGYLLAAFGGQSAGFEAYRPAMYYAGSLSLVAAILTALLRFQINPKLKSKV